MKIGILHAGNLPQSICNKHGDYPDLLKASLSDPMFTFQVWKVYESSFPEEGVFECDAWIVTGSDDGVYDEIEWIKTLKAFVKNAFENHVTLVGHCFGHQLIASALGGIVEKYPGGWTFGVETLQFKSQKCIHLLAYHQDQVIKKPKSASVIASSAQINYAGLQYGRRALTYQVHSEIFGEALKDLVICEDDEIPAHAATRALSTMERKTSHLFISQYIKKFIKTSYYENRTNKRKSIEGCIIS